MSDLDDLSSAVATLIASVDTLVANVAAADIAIQVEITALKNALGGQDQAAIEAAVANIQQASANLGKQSAMLSADTDAMKKSVP